MTQAIEIATDDTVSPIRALHSLTPAQANQISVGISSLATAWSVERHESCNGHLSVLLTNKDGDVTLLVDSDAGGMRVSAMLGDVLHTTPKRYTSLASVVSTLKALAGKNVAVGQMLSA